MATKLFDHKLFLDGGSARTQGNETHAIVFGGDDSNAVTYGNGSHALSIGTGEVVESATWGLSSCAIASGMESLAETHAHHSPAVAFEVSGSYSDASAATHGNESPAVAVVKHRSVSAANAESEGFASHAVAIGPDCWAYTSGYEAHAVALGVVEKVGILEGVAQAFREGSIAFAPAGVARSEQYLAIGLQVMLVREDSVGVILPPPFKMMAPVVVTGRTHPTGVRLALNDDGEVIEVGEW